MSECLTLAPIPNGAITYDPDMTAAFEVDTVATHRCDDGFILVVGSETRVCLNTGIWSGLIPVCGGTYYRFVKANYLIISYHVCFYVMSKVKCQLTPLTNRLSPIPGSAPDAHTVCM